MRYVIDDPLQQERMIGRFRKLIGELMRGSIARNTFEPWEIEILLDIETCFLEPRTRGDTLRKYFTAVERQLERGEGPPMKLSAFLQSRITRLPDSS
jgi:hypothetical protein